MARFKQEKTRLTSILQQDDWQEAINHELVRPGQAPVLVNPLLAFLNRPELRHKAAWSLGRAVALIAAESMEQARVIMRRMMWSMNEESGNLGWGIPEAMGCILAESPELAREYGRILLSYGHDTGIEDNFVDHAPLRRGVRWAIGRFAAARPEAALRALPQMVAALDDPDPEAAGLAAWALGQLAARPAEPASPGPASPEAVRPGLADQENAPLLRQALERLRALEELPERPVQIFDGSRLVDTTVKALAAAARRLLLPQTVV